jgi:hypothetical protein
VTASVAAIPAPDYHEDPCDTPSLSSSIATVLCSATPAHAWHAHPRLNPNHQPRHADRFDIGTAAHAMLLEGITAVEVVDAPDWRTKEAREARDQAHEAGNVPLLAGQLAAVEAMVAAAREQLAAHSADPPLFTDGQPEQTIVWRDQGVLCRARLDWLRDDHLAIDDYKTTGRSASRDAYERAIYGQGGDVQAAFYIRAVEALAGVTPEWRWVVQETEPPYALSVLSPSPAVLTIGAKKVEYALGLWRRCLERDEWPGYPARVEWVELPPWEEERWLAKELREVMAA